MYIVHVLNTPSKIVRCRLYKLSKISCVQCVQIVLTLQATLYVVRVRIVHNLQDTLCILCMCCIHPQRLYVVCRLYEPSKISCVYCAQIVHTLKATVYLVCVRIVYNLQYTLCILCMCCI